MKLKIYDVFVLRELTTTGTFANVEQRKGLLKKCTLSPEELEKLGVLLDVSGRIGFNGKEKENVDVTINKEEKEFIKNKLSKLDSEGNLRIDQASLYNLFVK